LDVDLKSGLAVLWETDGLGSPEELWRETIQEKENRVSFKNSEKIVKGRTGGRAGRCRDGRDGSSGCRSLNDNGGGGGDGGRGKTS
jgi:hypothetical protein